MGRAALASGRECLLSPVFSQTAQNVTLLAGLASLSRCVASAGRAARCACSPGLGSPAGWPVCGPMGCYCRPDSRGKSAGNGDGSLSSKSSLGRTVALHDGPDSAPHSHGVRRGSRFVEPSGSPLSGGCLLGLLRAWTPQRGPASAVTLSEAGQRVSAQTVWGCPGIRERRESNPQIGLHLSLPCHWASLPEQPRHRARAWVLRFGGIWACWPCGGPAYAVTRQVRDDRPGPIGGLPDLAPGNAPARASRR